MFKIVNGLHIRNLSPIVAIIPQPISNSRNHPETLQEAYYEDTYVAVLQGKLLIDVTVPLVPPKVGTVQMPEVGSAAQEAHKVLGEGVQVTPLYTIMPTTTLPYTFTIDLRQDLRQALLAAHRQNRVPETDQQCHRSQLCGEPADGVISAGLGAT
jgi:hypothetical protein